MWGSSVKNLEYLHPSSSDSPQGTLTKQPKLQNTTLQEFFPINSTLKAHCSNNYHVLKITKRHPNRTPEIALSLQTHSWGPPAHIFRLRSKFINFQSKIIYHVQCAKSKLNNPHIFVPDL